MSLRRSRLIPYLALAFLLTFPGHTAAVEGARAVPSPMGGNGHNVSFDGRIFIVRTGPGWEVRVLRPERITRDATGFPDVSDAFAPGVLIQRPDNEENALAICEPDSASTPYRCNAAGDAEGGGAFACYDVIVIGSNAAIPGRATRPSSASSGAAASSTSGWSCAASSPRSPATAACSSSRACARTTA